MKIDNETYKFAQYYAIGYYEGRVHGRCISEPETDGVERHAYRAGYERGVADYCELCGEAAE